MTDLPAFAIVCSKCGKFEPASSARFRGWLFGQLADGRWIMRCPDHGSAHARRLLGLPGRVASKRVESLLFDQGRVLYVNVGEVGWAAWTADRFAGEKATVVFALEHGVRDSDDPHQLEEFASLDALILAMAQVADLRTWVASPAG